MADFSHPPFQPGTTAGVTAATDLTEWEGRDFWFEDVDYASTDAVKPRRSNRLVKRRVVRNVSPTDGSTAGAILPKHLVRYMTGQYKQQVDGYVRLEADPVAGVSDEFLPTTGVVRNDLFYITCYGPSFVANAVSQFGDIAEGDSLVSLTAASSGTSTAGKVRTAAYTATTDLANHIKNTIGRAMSAVSSSSTSGNVLVDLRCDAI